MNGKLAFGIQENFEGGWAIIPFVEKPHRWVKRDVAKGSVLWRSACGRAEAITNKERGIEPLVLGNFEKCKLCERMKR